MPAATDANYNETDPLRVKWKASFNDVAVFGVGVGVNFNEIACPVHE